MALDARRRSSTRPGSGAAEVACRCLSDSSLIRSNADGWTVTNAVAPSSSGSGRPRALPIVVGRPSTHAGGGRAKRDDDRWLDDRALQILPAAAIDFVGVRPLVQRPLAPHLVCEVLHRIGDEDALAIDSSLSQSTVQHAPSRPDKGQAGLVFLVAWLLADQHHRRPTRPLPRHRLCGVLRHRRQLFSASRKADSEGTTGPLTLS